MRSSIQRTSQSVFEYWMINLTLGRADPWQYPGSCKTIHRHHISRNWFYATGHAILINGLVGFNIHSDVKILWPTMLSMIDFTFCLPLMSFLETLPRKLFQTLKHTLRKSGCVTFHPCSPVPKSKSSYLMLVVSWFL